MYHQLGKFTGRMMAASHLQSPLFPIAPIALQRVEAPTITYNTSHMSTVTEACSAGGQQRLIPGTNIPFAPVPKEIVKKQNLFQKDNDQPVFLKGGAVDGILYRLTMGLCIVAIAGVLHTIYGHAFPKKQ